MIIITPENFKFFGIIPKNFTYFSLNPEINYLYDLEKIKLRSHLTVCDLKNLISFQETYED